MSKVMAEDLKAWVLDQVGQGREELVELCRALVEAPSVNPPGDTRAVAEVVRRAIGSYGLLCRSVAGDPLMPNLLVCIDSGRPGPHLVLNAHLDTMPPGPEELWIVARYGLTREHGRLYGLGMGNMKGALAAMVMAMAVLSRCRPRWSGRVTLAAVSDEVVFGDNGAAFLLANDADLGKADAVISGEGPGFKRLAIGEKGVLWLRLLAGAAGGHSSAARPGASAIARLAQAVAALDALGGAPVDVPSDLSTVDLDPHDPAATLTVNVGTIAGGTFIGQIPVEARAEVDLRLPPGVTADGTERRVVELLADIDGLSVERIKGWDPNWTSPRDSLTTCFQAAHQVVRGLAAAETIRLPASDASRWRSLGVPAVCYGPQPTLSAGVDDYAEEQEVLDCVTLYLLTALAFLGAE